MVLVLALALFVFTVTAIVRDRRAQRRQQALEDRCQALRHDVTALQNAHDRLAATGWTRVETKGPANDR